MKHMLFVLLAPLAVLLALPACKKDNADPNGLPPATQEGKNTAGFLLNGQPWLPKGSVLGSNPSGVNATWNPTSFRPNLTFGFGRYNDGDITDFGFRLPGLHSPGTVMLNQPVSLLLGNKNPAHGLYVIHLPSPDRYFLTGPSARGQVIITRFDTVARVVSGTFEAKVKEDGGPDSLTITQGRFDLKF